MNKKKSLLVLFSFLMVLAATTVSFACACCAERGTYLVSTITPDAYHLGLLKEMRFGATPELYTTAGEDETGLPDLGEGNLSLIDAFTNNTWKLNIKTAAGKSGTLVLPRPARMTTRKVDLHEKSEGEPSLYKEFVFNGAVGSGSGIFKSSVARPAKYTLVFQGSGNMCDNAEDFKNWRLEVTGAKADYAFFGKMRSGD